MRRYLMPPIILRVAIPKMVRLSGPATSAAPLLTARPLPNYAAGKSVGKGGNSSGNQHADRVVPAESLLMSVSKTENRPITALCCQTHESTDSLPSALNHLAFVSGRAALFPPKLGANAVPVPAPARRCLSTGACIAGEICESGFGRSCIVKARYRSYFVG